MEEKSSLGQLSNETLSRVREDDILRIDWGPSIN